MKTPEIEDVDKSIGATPIFIRSKTTSHEQHIASGTISEEVFRVCHDFKQVYVTFPNRPNKDSFAVDLIKLVESAFFFDMKKKETYTKKVLKKVRYTITKDEN